MNGKMIKWIALVLCVAVLAGAAGIGFACRNTDIPKLYFEGNVASLVTKADSCDITVAYDDGETVTKGYASLKIQGTSSQWYPKKNYTINFYEDQAHDSKLKLDLGWGPQSKYCMKANWIDRTHARNVVTAKLVSQVQDRYGLLTQAPRNGAVDGFPVEIYVNGSFHGLYTFNIPKDTWQFAMDKEDPDHIVICGEDDSDVGRFLAMPNFESWAVEVGEESDETLEKMNRLFDFVLNSTDEEFRADFGEYLDLDATLNYYILADFAYMQDNVSKNMLIATYDGQVWYPSLYDLDTTWGTDYNGKTVYDYENKDVNLSRSRLFDRVQQLCSQELADRYFELRQDLLTKEHIMAEFEAFRAQIPWLTFVQDGVKWGSGVIRQPSDLPGFDYDQIEAFLDHRIPALDEQYAALRNG